MSKTDHFRLEHISVCIEKIIKLTEIIQTLENFEERWVEQDAMIRNFRDFRRSFQAHKYYRER
jgi:uncharacterized protein with HEPN domain